MIEAREGLLGEVLASNAIQLAELGVRDIVVQKALDGQVIAANSVDSWVAVTTVKDEGLAFALIWGETSDSGPCIYVDGEPLNELPQMRGEHCVIFPIKDKEGMLMPLFTEEHFLQATSLADAVRALGMEEVQDSLGAY